MNAIEQPSPRVYAVDSAKAARPNVQNLRNAVMQQANSVSELPTSADSQHVQGILMEEILSKLPGALVVTDAENRTLFTNDLAKQIFKDEVPDSLINALPTIPTDAAVTLNLGAGQPTLEIMRSQLFSNDTTTNLYLIRDVTQVADLIANLREMCLTDQLTGAYNRRGFLTVARHFLEAARRENRTVLLIFADFDGLKTINDLHGHTAGDAALADLANIFKQSLRTSDIIARIGGDEFVILTSIPFTEFAKLVVSRLEAEVDYFNRSAVRPFALSASFGMAKLKPETAVDLDDLISQADHEMYRCKRGFDTIFEAIDGAATI